MPENRRNVIAIFAILIRLTFTNTTVILSNEPVDQSTHSFCNIAMVYPSEYNDSEHPFIMKFQSVFEGQQPVILKGGASNWAAASMWSIENLRDSAEYASVRLSFNRAPLGR